MQTPTQFTGQATAATGRFAPLQRHLPEYLMEALNLGLFMFAACAFTVLLEHPMSPAHQALLDWTVARRALMGLAMGLTAIALISSPWGQRSGAHLNPAVTLTYWALGKISRVDALAYIAFQLLGGITGVMMAELLIGPPLRHSAVNYAVTSPGRTGLEPALLAEFLISFLLMTTVLAVSNSRTLTRYTPLFAGALVASFITFEAPISGMSMNPARTLGSAAAAHYWSALWIYFLAPPAGMLMAGLLHRLMRGPNGTFCAKLHHCNSQRCIFRCRFGELHAC
jgi:aquaporin Z